MRYSLNRAIIAVISVVAGLAVSSTAIAGTQQGTITSVSADHTFNNTGVVLIGASGTPAGRPGCATDRRWTINVAGNRPGTQYLYSLILTAMASGWTVNITGTGNCSTLGNIEEIAYVEVVR